ncbi:protein TCL1B2-like isoform X2 [Mesocricetus auratus]|uniref:Protein TCL1B2-like isoform X2 n=1 Tax=Mesocricetus auratus TaxID=10036 RepID=A0ABM2X6M0_MESAU|nr:protein TCL1B2-like isoform X2 [Mesocricetus auratus]
MAPAILGLPPVILSLVTPGYYRDEMQRLWMVVSLRFTPDHPTHNMPRACISVSLWQRLPLELYCGTDQMYWIMAAHVQVMVALLGPDSCSLSEDFMHLFLCLLHTFPVSSPSCLTQLWTSHDWLL